jgi:hypothetical protein
MDIPRRIRPVDAYEVFIGNERSLTGCVDAAPATATKTSVSGRMDWFMFLHRFRFQQ